MKIARFRFRDKIWLGRVEPPDVFFPDAQQQAAIVSVNWMIGHWDQWETCFLRASNQVPISEVQLLAPNPHPQKLVCIGRNYAEHAAEQGASPGDVPTVFSKFSSAIIGPGEPIGLPSVSKQVDYEAELVVVMGRAARQVSRQAALNYVIGYCCGNDITARDRQKDQPGGQWLLGKTIDTFAPLGPWICTRDELPNPQNLEIRLRRNGSLMQQANTSRMLFPVDQLIAYISRFITLQPGDLIYTGTPSGVGAARNPPVFLQAGDQLEVEIQGIGILQNPVVDAAG